MLSLRDKSGRVGAESSDRHGAPTNKAEGLRLFQLLFRLNLGIGKGSGGKSGAKDTPD